MYKYSQENAQTYSKLGIEGTTYQVGFDEVRKILGDLTGKTALDFGCGAGRTARLLLSMNAKKVVGVDHNQSMIDQAKKVADERLDFIKIGETIPFESDTFDVATAAHVFVEVSSAGEMRQISKEIYRVLKPGGVFIVVTNNSNAIGQEYLSFGYEKQVNFVSGQKIPCTIKKGKDSFVIDDFFWFEEDYREALEAEGFNLSMTFPLAEGEGWMDETEVAPNVVIKCVK